MQDWQRLLRRRIADRVATWESRNLDAFLNNESFSEFGRYIEVLFMAQSKPVVKTFYRQGLSALLIKDNGEGARFVPRVRSQVGLFWKPTLKADRVDCPDRTLKSNLLIDIEQEVRLNANRKKKELVFDRESDVSFLKIEEFNSFLKQFPAGLSKVGSASSLDSARSTDEWRGLASLIHIASPVVKESPPPPPSLLRKTNERLGGGRLMPAKGLTLQPLKKGLLPPLAIHLAEPSKSETESLSKASHVSMESSRSLSKKVRNQGQAGGNGQHQDPLESPLKVFAVRVPGAAITTFQLQEGLDPQRFRRNLALFDEIRRRFGPPGSSEKESHKSCFGTPESKPGLKLRKITSMAPEHFGPVRLRGVLQTAVGK